MECWTLLTSQFDHLVFAPELYTSEATAEGELRRWLHSLSSWQQAEPKEIADHYWVAGGVEVRMSPRLLLDTSHAAIWVGTTWSWLGGVSATALLSGRDEAWRWAVSPPTQTAEVLPEVLDSDRMRVRFRQGQLVAASEARPAKIVVSNPGTSNDYSGKNPTNRL